MVDFNSDQMLTTNKGEILNLIILGRRDELLNTFQAWREACISNSSNKSNLETKLRACLFVLFLELERPLYRSLHKQNKDKTINQESKDKFERLKEFVYSNKDAKEGEIKDAYETLNTFLDDINLTKIDTKKNFDSRNIEDENREKGM